MTKPDNTGFLEQANAQRRQARLDRARAPIGQLDRNGQPVTSAQSPGPEGSPAAGYPARATYTTPSSRCDRQDHPPPSHPPSAGPPNRS